MAEYLHKIYTVNRSGVIRNAREPRTSPSIVSPRIPIISKSFEVLEWKRLKAKNSVMTEIDIYAAEAEVEEIFPKQIFVYVDLQSVKKLIKTATGAKNKRYCLFRKCFTNGLVVKRKARLGNARKAIFLLATASSVKSISLTDSTIWIAESPKTRKNESLRDSNAFVEYLLCKKKGSARAVPSMPNAS